MYSWALFQSIALKDMKGACQMQKSGIPVPLHIIVDRDSLSGDEKDPAGFVETEDYVELNGMATSYQKTFFVHAGLNERKVVSCRSDAPVSMALL